MDIEHAVNASRFHHQWIPDLIYVEQNSFSKETLDSLKILGHQIKQRSPMGHVNAIHIDHKMTTGADKRGSNSAAILVK